MDNTLTFRLPTQLDEAVLRDYVREHHDHGETDITASCGLEKAEFSSWLSTVRADAEAVAQRSEEKSELLLLCFCGEALVGLLVIRYRWSEELRNIYGDIGYGVRPSMRRCGYATKMLTHALALCRTLGMENVILGCYRDNIGSAHTIVRNGGVLLRECDAYTRGRISQYYRIDLIS